MLDMARVNKNENDLTKGDAISIIVDGTLRCGAKLKNKKSDGHTKCKRRPVKGKLRCPIHGGKDSGPPKGNTNAVSHGATKKSTAAWFVRHYPKATQDAVLEASTEELAEGAIATTAALMDSLSEEMVDLKRRYAELMVNHNGNPPPPLVQPIERRIQVVEKGITECAKSISAAQTRLAQSKKLLDDVQRGAVESERDDEARERTNKMLEALLAPRPPEFVPVFDEE